jgi:2-iminobutanoate/2-iminopropanoate deaminase
VAQEFIQTDQAPAPIGPYSQAVKAGGFVFLSGQIPLDPSTNQMVTGDVQAQAEQVMKNLRAVLEAAGLSFAAVVRATIYLKDMGDFQAVNEIYGKHLGEHRPARAAVQVAALPKGADVEIEMTALAE